MAESKVKPKTEEEILFPDLVVEGIKLRPWTLGQYADLAPHFRKAKVMLQEGGIDFAKIEELIKALDAKDEAEINEGLAKKIVGPFFDIVMLVLPILPQVLSVTTGIPLSEVRGWDVKKITPVTIAVVTQNIEHLKNSFGLGTSPGLGKLKAMTTASAISSGA